MADLLEGQSPIKFDEFWGLIEQIAYIVAINRKFRDKRLFDYADCLIARMLTIRDRSIYRYIPIRFLIERQNQITSYVLKHLK